MPYLKINDHQLNQSTQHTLAILLSHGISTAGKHHLPAMKVSGMGLSVRHLRELVSAGLVETTASNGGQIVRPRTPVATEVELFDSGDIDVTLALDLSK